MTQPRTRIAVALVAAGLTSCSSAPPKPPEVDESGRRPANSANAVELQVCRAELADARAEVSQARRIAQTSSAALAQVTVEELRRAADAPSARPAAAAPVARAPANVVWTLPFAFNSSRIDATPEELRRVVEAAKTAAWVVVRGRTDGVVETPGESTIARRRMAAMYDVLLRGGVDPRRIALQYQPVGDHLADNGTEEGRAANRRAEVELYPAMPERLAVHAVPALATADPM
jgi:outer membrane protein OmpA-like peptidoglycan-associated protein